MNFSFGGCGFLGIYHVGVAGALQKYHPNVDKCHFTGSSAGSLAAVALACNLPMGDFAQACLQLARDVKRLFMGPLNPNFKLSVRLREMLDKILPEDVHIKVKGKLAVSVTKVNSGQNEIITKFESREHLIDVLLCSSFIPLYDSTVPPTIKGIPYIDGAFSNNQPKVYPNTVTVSALAGSVDICPTDHKSVSPKKSLNISQTNAGMTMNNLFRMPKIMIPPSATEMMSICMQGFNDCLAYLHKKGIVACLRCLVKPLPQANKQEKEELEFDEKVFKQLAEAIHSTFKNAIIKEDFLYPPHLLANMGKLIDFTLMPYHVTKFALSSLCSLAWSFFHPLETCGKLVNLSFLFMHSWGQIIPGAVYEVTQICATDGCWLLNSLNETKKSCLCSETENADENSCACLKAQENWTKETKEGCECYRLQTSLRKVFQPSNYSSVVGPYLV